MMQHKTLIVAGAMLWTTACGGTKQATETTTPVAAKSMGGGATDVGPTHCPAADATHEVSEYDTSGDEISDVRKIFLRIGDGSLARLVLVCRETDLNSDGVKDVVRHYTDEGRPLREDSDTDFDGTMDSVTVYQDGSVIRQEIDSTHDGKVDTKIFFENGKPLRAERDLNGRSTDAKWQPDRWEYYEEGHMVRMGTDLDGDGKVDRWDRDQSLRRPPEVESGATDATDA
jgi:hypothetical protein